MHGLGVPSNMARFVLAATMFLRLDCRALLGKSGRQGTYAQRDVTQVTTCVPT